MIKRLIIKGYDNNTMDKTIKFITIIDDSFYL